MIPDTGGTCLPLSPLSHGLLTVEHCLQSPFWNLTVPGVLSLPPVPFICRFRKSSSHVGSFLPAWLFPPTENTSFHRNANRSVRVLWLTSQQRPLPAGITHACPEWAATLHVLRRAPNPPPHYSTAGCSDTRPHAEPLSWGFDMCCHSGRISEVQ